MFYDTRDAKSFLFPQEALKGVKAFFPQRLSQYREATRHASFRSLVSYLMSLSFGGTVTYYMIAESWLIVDHSRGDGFAKPNGEGDAFGNIENGSGKCCSLSIRDCLLSLRPPLPSLLPHLLSETFYSSLINGDSIVKILRGHTSGAILRFRACDSFASRLRISNNCLGFPPRGLSSSTAGPSCFACPKYIKVPSSSSRCLFSFSFFRRHAYYTGIYNY